MGAGYSVEPRYSRIWQNLTEMQSDEARLRTLDTLLVGQEFVNMAKRTGVYAPVLAYIAAQRRGEFAVWPGGGLRPNQPQGGHAPPSTPFQGGHPSAGAPRLANREPTLQIHDAPRRSGSTVLATVPPPKRALDVLHESYYMLGLDDSQPLTHEVLKSAYKRAAIKAHPDKGGNPELFDKVTRAYTYLDEVLQKLIPKTAKDGTDARFHAPVTLAHAKELRQAAGLGADRGAARAPVNANVLELEDEAVAPIALNPKNLNMTTFNKLFEENRLPDPDGDDGYGDWLKKQEHVEVKTYDNLRQKFNSDVFHKTFAEETRSRSAAAAETSVSKYRAPSELILAPSFGVELGAERPAQYTKAPNAQGIGYTDLKFAYGQGSTFSQEVADVSTDGRPSNLEDAKREYGTAPRALSMDEAAAVAAFDRAKQVAEEDRQRRMAARDVDAETAHNRLQKRLLVRN